MGDSKKIKEVCKQLELGIQSFYRLRQIKKLRPDLYDKLRKDDALSITQTYQEVTGRQLKIKKTVCLDPIESQKLELAKEILDLNYSEMLKLGLKCLYKTYGIEFEE